MFDKILSIFGKDIKENIVVLFTFADGQKPQAVSSLQAVGVLDMDDVYFKFNNSAFFWEDSEEDEDFVHQLFWKNGMKSFEEFFTHAESKQPKSLVLTKDVLMERENLQIKVKHLQDEIKRKINIISQLAQMKKVYEIHAEDINANRNFTYMIDSEETIELKVKPGTYAANCPTCECTCHYPCTISNKEKLRRCRAIRWWSETCRECPKECHWSTHRCDKFRWERRCIKVKKEHDAKKASFIEALEGRCKAEVAIMELENELSQVQKTVVCYISDMRRSQKRLLEIALKKDPLQETDYLDILIEVEKTQEKPNLEKLNALLETKKLAQDIHKFTRPDYTSPE